MTILCTLRDGASRGVSQGTNVAMAVAGSALVGRHVVNDAREFRRNRCSLGPYVIVLMREQSSGESSLPPEAVVHRVRPVLIGLGTTFVFIMMLQSFAGIFWPAPPGLDSRNEQAILAAQEAAPMIAKIYAVMTYGVAVFVAAFLARKIAGGINTTPSWIVGAATTVFCISNALTSPAPLWMHIGTILLPLPAAWCGLTLAAERRRVDANANGSPAR
jgi:hypothetical protein